MTQSAFRVQPDRIQRSAVAVMEQTTIDELSAIQVLWPSFEQLVGLQGRKMYARVDETRNTYTVCTPLREVDRPDSMGLRLGTLAGGWYLRGRIVGEPPLIYGLIGDGMAELQAMMPTDPARPLVEFYRRRDTSSCGCRFSHDNGSGPQVSAAFVPANPLASSFWPRRGFVPAWHYYSAII